MQTLFYQTMALAKQRPTLAHEAFQTQRQVLEGQLAALLEIYPSAPDSQRLWRRYGKHRAALLLCLTRADVPATNNASEQALRNSVIYRKVTNGFRSRWAADLYANLLSILETARRQGRDVFATLKTVLAPHPDLAWIAE